MQLVLGAHSFRGLGPEHAHSFFIVLVDGLHCCDGFVGC